MFVCNLRCVHGGVNCTVAIAKGSDGKGKVYDSNHKDSMELCLESLNGRLQTVRCGGFDMVVEQCRKR